MAQSKKKLVALVFLCAAMPGAAHAQRFVCADVRPGDTAADLALRLTNDADARNQAWFRIEIRLRLHPSGLAGLPCDQPTDESAEDDGWCVARGEAAP